LQKYDPAGNPKWQRELLCADKSKCDVSPSAVTSDSANNVYVVGQGSLADPVQANDLFVRRWDSEGRSTWTRHFDSAHVPTLPAAIAVDPLGAVYVAGRIDGDALLLRWPP
jgi:DNA-binding beta-propeller fold protein YncE